MFSVFTVLTVYKLDATCRVVRQMSVQFFRFKRPPFGDSGRSIRPMIDVIYCSTKALEFLAVLFTVTTTAQHLIGYDCNKRTREGIVEEEYNHGMETTILPFEMSYRLGAHQSFLLSLFLLAATCPTCSASVGGAILASSWRLI
jgi:hypothetical protein